MGSLEYSRHFALQCQKPPAKLLMSYYKCPPHVQRRCQSCELKSSDNAISRGRLLVSVWVRILALAVLHTPLKTNSQVTGAEDISSTPSGERGSLVIGASTELLYLLEDVGRLSFFHILRNDRKGRVNSSVSFMIYYYF